LPSGLAEAEISYKQVKIDYLKALFNYIDSQADTQRHVDEALKIVLVLKKND